MDGWNFEDVSFWGPDGAYFQGRTVSLRECTFSWQENIYESVCFTFLYFFHIHRKFRSPNEAHCLWFALVWYLETHKSSSWIIWTVCINTIQLTYFLRFQIMLFFTIKQVTPPKINSKSPWKMMVGRRLSFWKNCSSHKRRKSRATWITASQPKQKYDNKSKKKIRTTWAKCL